MVSIVYTRACCKGKNEGKLKKTTPLSFRSGIYMRNGIDTFDFFFS